ncbi:uncharacterized protein LOC143022724 [Oratosquilla oratoria]|uniref:uncharacterized protein LOC143022724 n=1 Tax=Oratosquilla oratoria TaxID=337810 RepID=UPI003F767306
MPPKRPKHSAKALQKPAAPAPTRRPRADSSSDDDGKQINVDLPGEVSCQQQEETAMLSVESEFDIAASQASQTSATSGKSARKAKTRALMHYPEQEQSIADWYKEHEWLYNFRSAAELDITSAELKTWVKSKKDLAAKILKLKTWGSAAKTMTDREQWVYDNFRHAAGFVKCVAEHKRKKAGQLPPRKTTVVEPAEGSTRPLHSDKDDVPSEAASSNGGTHVTETSSATKDQLTQQAKQLVTMLRRQEHKPDSRDGNKRALADLVYHASGRMDDDTYDDFQAQCFPLISNFQLTARRKRESQQHTGTWQPTVAQQMPQPAYPQQPQAPQPTYVGKHMEPQHQAYVAQQMASQPLLPSPQAVVSQPVGQLQRSLSASFQLQSLPRPTAGSSSNIIGQAFNMMNTSIELGNQSYSSLLNQLSSTPKPSKPSSSPSRRQSDSRPNTPQ